MRATLAVVVTKGLAAAATLGVLVLVMGAAKPSDPSGDFCGTGGEVAASASYGALVDLDDSPVPVAASASIAAPTSAISPTPPPRAGSSLAAEAVGACPHDMVLIDGNECSEVEQPCLEWAKEAPGEEERMRCLRFGPSRCTGKRAHVRFCIDRYEYPNQKGRLPVVMKT